MALSGIHGASPDDVVVTVGGQQAIDLLARLFLDPGDVVLAEGPTYVRARSACSSPPRPRCSTWRWTPTG